MYIKFRCVLLRAGSILLEVVAPKAGSGGVFRWVKNRKMLYIPPWVNCSSGPYTHPCISCAGCMFGGWRGSTALSPPVFGLETGKLLCYGEALEYFLCVKSGFPSCGEASFCLSLDVSVEY